MIKSILKVLSPRHQSLFLEYKTEFKPRYTPDKPHGELYKIINSEREAYKSLLHEVLQYKADYHNIRDCKHTEGYEPCWNNEYLPGLDIIIIYALTCLKKPKRVVEIGSGNSTKVFNAARKNHDLEIEITSIDPYPRADIDAISDIVKRERFENVKAQDFDALSENDFVFVDNSHRILPNSDAMVFFMEVLPKLKKGVIVQIHDIYLPYDYPQFMCDRFYSEQYGLAFYLLANPDRYKVISPNFFISEDNELKKIIEPVWNHPNLENVERHGGSFWFQVQ